MKTIGIIGLVASVVATVGARATHEAPTAVTQEEALKLPKIGITIGEEENLKLPKIGITIGEEEALNLLNFINEKVIGEEQNMSLLEMAKRYNKVKKFIPVAEQENLKLPKIGVTIGEEEAIKIPKIGITIGEEEAFNLIKFMEKKVVGVSEEEAAFNLKHYIAHNVIGISEEEALKLPPIHVTIGEEENMSLIEMAKRYNKVKKFIPVAEQENLKLPKIGITIGEEQNVIRRVPEEEALKNPAMCITTAEEEAFNLKKFIKEKVIGVSEEEAAFNLKHYIAHNVIGITEEEENMSLVEMAKRYNKVKKFIPVAEEQNFSEGGQKELMSNNQRFTKSGHDNGEILMSLKTMFDRYNKVKKFVPPMEEEAIKIPKIGITIGEEEAMSLKTMFNRYSKVKRFIPPMFDEEAFIEAPQNF